MKERSLLNTRGDSIPVETIRPEHLKKHLAVEQIWNDAAKMEQVMIKAKVKIMDKILKYKIWITKFNGMDDAEFENLQLTNYPGTIQIHIKSAKCIDFDENIQLAKKKIDSCFARWGEGANSNLKVIVDSYFKVGEKGLLNKKSILGLFQFDIKDAEWDQAMELVKKSIVIASKKEYLIIRHRENNKAEWQTLDLNFSSIEIK